MADLISLLECERDHLLAVERLDFFRRLPRYVRLLKSERGVGRMLLLLRVDADLALEAYVNRTNGLFAEVVELRHRLVELAPEVDDSGALEPEDDGTHAYSDWMFTLAYFDALERMTTRVGFPLLPSDEAEPSHIAELTNILRGKLKEAQYGGRGDLNDQLRVNQRPDLD